MTATTQCRECGKPAKVRGLCDTDYRRHKRQAATAARRAAGEPAPRRYPWHRWFDGHAHVVAKAQLPKSLRSFDNQVRLAADKRGLKATVRHLPSGEIVIQAQPRP